MDQIKTNGKRQIPIIPEKNAELKQNRIINIDHFLLALKTISGYSKVFACSLQNLIVSREIKCGLNSKIIFVCNMCHQEFMIDTCPKQETVNINYLGVQAANGVGMRYFGLEEVLGVLNVPCMTESTYFAHQKTFQPDVSAVCTKKMFEAAIKAKSIAWNLDDDGTPLLTVSADACFSKRTYGGIAAIHHCQQLVLLYRMILEKLFGVV